MLAKYINIRLKNILYLYKSICENIFLFPFHCILYLMSLPKEINYKVKYSIIPRLYQIKMYKNVRIGYRVEFLHGNNIEIGENSTILHSGYIWAGYESKIIIGKDVMIGPNTMIVAFDHGMVIDPKTPFKKQDYLEKDIIIGNNVWIGANVVILKGVEIGDNCVVAAGSVITKSLKNNSIAAGIKAKVIKQLE